MPHSPLSSNIIFGGDGLDKTESHEYIHGFNPHDEWHTYTLEWTPDYINVSIDGREVRHVEDRAIVERIGREQSLRMNFWTPEFHVWGQGLNASDMPWYLLYDYVEVFTYDVEDNEFHLHWRDDFDTFDTQRWQKATGGFEQNSSVFHPENVSVKAGNLVIKMEPIVHAHAVTHHNLHHRRGHGDAHFNEGDVDYQHFYDEDYDHYYGHAASDHESSDTEGDWNDHQDHYVTDDEHEESQE